MDQNPNTPPQNQNQNQDQNQMLGFSPYSGEFMSMLTQGNISPNIPNQRQFVQTSSPPIAFQHIHQSFNPQTGTFQPTFPAYQQTQFQQTQFQQTQNQHTEYGGGSSSASIPLFSTQRPSLQPVNDVQVEAPQPAKKKKATRQTQRKKATSEPQEEPIAWTEAELVALADAWCSTSQDEVRGNDQDKDGYWATIRKKFQETLGKGENYRSTDSLTSKWGQMKTKITKFNGIYQRIENNPPSGWNEVKMLEEAQLLYRQSTRNNEFTLLNVWNRIRFEPKWLNVTKKSASSGSKRSHGESSMGSDAHINIDLNAGSDSFPVGDDDVEEVDPLHNRPARGRDRAKRIQRFGDNMDAKAKHREKIERNLDAHIASVEEKKAMRQRQVEQHQELVEQQRLINHLTIMEKGGIKPGDEELIDEAKNPSRNWLKKLFKK